MVKRLAGKKGRGVATEADLQMAAKTVRRRFVVGLTDEMEESVRRFNAVMGVDEGDEWVRRVMATFFGGERSKRINSNPHPEVSLRSRFGIRLHLLRDVRSVQVPLAMSIAFPPHFHVSVRDPLRWKVEARRGTSSPSKMRWTFGCTSAFLKFFGSKRQS